jgi:FlaG/FlaF family flagellin (archaellin)
MKCPLPPDSAVSPVVGVMLMLAVTVMIAAIASAFAGGFSDTSEKNPQSSLSVTTNFDNTVGSTDYYRIYFDHTGGDPFSLDSIQVVFRSDETENKTQLSRQSINSNCYNFTLVGPDGPAYNDTTVRAGDRFFIDGMAVGTGDETGIQFGNTIFWKNKEIIWMVIDSRTSKTIAMGSIFPQ